MTARISISICRYFIFFMGFLSLIAASTGNGFLSSLEFFFFSNFELHSNKLMKQFFMTSKFVFQILAIVFLYYLEKAIEQKRLRYVENKFVYTFCS